MKHDWEYKKLGEISTIAAGQGAPQGDSNYSTQGTPFIKAGNLIDLINGIDENNIQKVTEDVAKSHKLRLYPSGSILFAKSGMSCMKGYVYTTKNDCYVVSHLAIVIPTKINASYLNFFLQVKKPNSLVKDEAYPSISLKDISDIEVPYPTKGQQTAIVSELDTLSGIITECKETLKDYDALEQSIFYDMFGDPVKNDKGWEVKKLEDLCDKIVDCPHSTPIKSETPTRFPCIRTSELRNGEISWDSMQYVGEKEYENRIARLQPQTDDIVFGREGSIGGAVILPEGYNFCLGQRTMLLRANRTLIEPVFLHRVILSDWIKNQIMDKNVASTVAHVNVKDVKAFLLPLPPLSLQQQFASKIEAIEQMKSETKKALQEAETLFQARMDYWFN